MQLVLERISAASLAFVLLAGHTAGHAQAIPSRADPTLPWVTPAISAPRLEHRSFYSSAVGTGVSYFVYRPEIYDADTLRRFPVLYWLHGSGGGVPGVRRLVTHFDAAIRGGQTPPMLVVFVNGLTNSMWCDSKDGRVPMETVVITELVPHIDATFRTIASRDGRLIEGLSMGGYGAARLGLKHHDLFGAVSILGGGPLQQEFDVSDTPRANVAQARALFDAVYGNDQEYFRAQSPWEWASRNAAAVRAGTRVRQIVGDRDATLENNRRFDAHLTELRIPHTFTVLPRVGHDPAGVLSALGEANWEFYRVVFGFVASGGPGRRTP